MADTPFYARMGMVANNSFFANSKQVSVVSGNVAIGYGVAVPPYSLTFGTTDAILVPSGNTAQRPTGTNGLFRYNNDPAVQAFEGYANGSWGSIGGSATSMVRQDFTGDGTTVNFTITGGYSVANGIDVYLNGIKQKGGGIDFTATNGSTIGFTNAPPNGSIIQVVAMLGAISFANAVPLTGGIMSGNLQLPTLYVGNTTVNSTINSTSISINVVFANTISVTNAVSANALIANTLSLGNSSVNATINSTALAFNGVLFSGGYKYLSTNTTLSTGFYLVDSSVPAASNLTLSLPTSPTLGTTMVLIDANNSWGNNNVTLYNNGSTIMGTSANLILNISDRQFTIWYNGSDWRLL